MFHVTFFPFDLCLAQPRAMAEEEQRRKLDRLKAVRRGHRGVLTKLTREVDEIDIGYTSKKLSKMARNSASYSSNSWWIDRL